MESPFASRFRETCDIGNIDGLYQGTTSVVPYKVQERGASPMCGVIELALPCESRDDVSWTPCHRDTILISPDCWLTIL